MTKSRPLNLSGTIVLLLLAILATGCPAMAASNGQTKLFGVSPNWGYADFDGDYKPDLLQLRRTFLELRLSTGKELRFASALGSDDPGVEIVVVDLDDDHDFDIVVRNRFLKQHLDIWLNDGKGTFTKSATHDFSLPIEQSSWRQLPTTDPGTALVVRISSLAADARNVWLQPPSSPGRKLQSASGILPARDHTDTSHLRGPPTPSFR
jgi:hypothetical protein